MASIAQSHRPSKVTIVGVGNVGLAAAYAMINQHVLSELVLIDIITDKVKGEILDLLHGAAASKLPTLRVYGGSDYSASAHSDVVILTAGVRQKLGETRLVLLKRNEVIVTSIVKEVVKYSPNAILLVATNPCDVMTYLAWKVSGFPPERVIGAGTCLDSSRFRHLLAERLSIDVRSLHACVIGEHGDSAVPLFSSVNICGTPLISLDSSFGKTAEWKAIGNRVIQAAYEVVKLKGYTSFGIGTVLASLVGSILRDERVITPVSTLVPEGLYGLPGPVYLSLPVVISQAGVKQIVPQVLTEEEHKMLLVSARKMIQAQQELMFKPSQPDTRHATPLDAQDLWKSMLKSRL